MSSTAPPDQSPEDAVAFAEGVLGAAGHEVTDSAAKGRLEALSRGEITIEQLIEEARRG